MAPSAHSALSISLLDPCSPSNLMLVCFPPSSAEHCGRRICHDLFLIFSSTEHFHWWLPERPFGICPARKTVGQIEQQLNDRLYHGNSIDCSIYVWFFLFAWYRWDTKIRFWPPWWKSAWKSTAYYSTLGAAMLLIFAVKIGFNICSSFSYQGWAANGVQAVTSYWCPWWTHTLSRRIAAEASYTT
jgi:hypothetical protein